MLAVRRTGDVATLVFWTCIGCAKLKAPAEPAKAISKMDSIMLSPSLQCKARTTSSLSGEHTRRARVGVVKFGGSDVRAPFCKKRATARGWA